MNFLEPRENVKIPLNNFKYYPKPIVDLNSINDDYEKKIRKDARFFI